MSSAQTSRLRTHEQRASGGDGASGTRPRWCCAPGLYHSCCSCCWRSRRCCYRRCSRCRGGEAGDYSSRSPRRAPWCERFARPCTSGRAGQATVEALVGAFVLIALAFAALQGFWLWRAHVAAHAAAASATAALAQGDDPRAALERALTPEQRRRTRLVVRGDSVAVTVRLARSLPGVPRALRTVRAHASLEGP